MSLDPMDLGTSPPVGGAHNRLPAIAPGSPICEELRRFGNDMLPPDIAFQSAPPHGGRRAMLKESDEAPAVSIRAPAWRATRDPRVPGWIASVSIRAPAWRATIPGPRGRAARQVSIRAPAWRATRQLLRRRPIPVVSIRAPAWRATQPSQQRRRGTKFQSAPPHGGRPARPFLGVSDEAFQSAPPHGGRRARPGAAPRVEGVSIRAPAWRATLLLAIPPALRRRFNPRPRMEGDAPRRGRAESARRFNPRPRMEGDYRSHSLSRTKEGFQSAPPHGGRQSTRALLAATDRFQSAPPHGGRPWCP